MGEKEKGKKGDVKIPVEQTPKWVSVFRKKNGFIAW